MSELIVFAIPFFVGLVVGIFIGMGLQVRSEIKWIEEVQKKMEEPKKGVRE